MRSQMCAIMAFEPRLSITAQPGSNATILVELLPLLMPDWNQKLARGHMQCQDPGWAKFLDSNGHTYSTLFGSYLLASQLCSLMFLLCRRPEFVYHSSLFPQNSYPWPLHRCEISVSFKATIHVSPTWFEDSWTLAVPEAKLYVILLCLS